MLWEFIAAVVVAVAGGAGGAAIINGINERKLHKIQHREAQEDKKELRVEERLNTLEEKVDAIVEANKYIMFDRIRYLGQRYIDAGEISFDDRRILNSMHAVYHNGLGGNGDIDKLMDDVNDLPLLIIRKNQV